MEYIRPESDDDCKNEEANSDETTPLCSPSATEIIISPATLQASSSLRQESEATVKNRQFLHSKLGTRDNV